MGLNSIKLIRKHKLSLIIDIHFTDIERDIIGYCIDISSNLTIYKNKAYPDSIFYMNKYGEISAEILRDFALSISKKIYRNLEIYGLKRKDITDLMFYFFKSDVKYFYVSLNDAFEILEANFKSKKKYII